MRFSARDSSFFFVKYEAGHFLQGHFLRHKFFFMIFFVLVCFQDEVKQLSSWKFLIGIGLVIGLAIMFLD